MGLIYCQYASQTDQVGFRQYYKALKEMQALMKNGSVSLDTVLVCSLLCIHFESLRGAHVASFLHLENAIHLLESTRFDARKISIGLVRALLRLDLQSTMYLGSRVPRLSFYTAAVDANLPSTLHDLTQARDLLNAWTNRLFFFMRNTADDYKFRDPGSVPLEEHAKAQALEQRFMDIDHLLWEFMHKPTSKLSLRESHGLDMLRSRVKINRILAATCLYCEATLFDRYLSIFQDIMAICTSTQNRKRCQGCYNVSLRHAALAETISLAVLKYARSHADSFILGMHITSSDKLENRQLSVSLDEGLTNPVSSKSAKDAILSRTPTLDAIIRVAHPW